MRPRHHASPQLERLVRRQFGVVTLPQALDDGLSRHSIARMVSEGRWSALSSGLYSWGAPTFPGVCVGGLLVAGDEALVAGRAAAHLHGLVAEAPRVVDIACERHVERAADWWRFRNQARSGGRHPRRVNPTDTVLDCLQDSTEDEAVALVGEALFQRLTSPQLLALGLARRSRQRHRALVHDLVAGDARGIDSPLEHRYLRDVVRAHGLPEGQRQVRVLGAHPSDVWLEEQRTIVELDGSAYHRGAKALADLELDAEASGRGILTIRLDRSQLVGSQACRTAARLANLLLARGWSGARRVRCATCRAAARIPRATS